MFVFFVVMEILGLMLVKMIDVFVLICYLGWFVWVFYLLSCFNIYKYVLVFGESVWYFIYVFDFVLDILYVLIV